MAAKHNNPSRDPLLPFGDTPLGVYVGTITPPRADTAGYGHVSIISLTPVSGDCVKAEKNGREGILCHSGDLNPTYTQWGGLRPTFGCVRFHEEDLTAILNQVLIHGQRLDVVIQAEASPIT